MGRLPRVDLGALAQQVAELVGAGQEHPLRERVHVEREVLVAGQVDDLRVEVDRQLGVRSLPEEIEELAMALRLDGDREQAVLQAVASEDIRERGRQDRADAPRGERPRGVLA